jgi:hypothetical protein
VRARAVSIGGNDPLPDVDGSDDHARSSYSFLVGLLCKLMVCSVWPSLPVAARWYQASLHTRMQVSHVLARSHPSAATIADCHLSCCGACQLASCTHLLPSLGHDSPDALCTCCRTCCRTYCRI